MRGGWIAGLIELCVYLFGFTVTGTLVARDCASRGKHPDDALCIVDGSAVTRRQPEPRLITVIKRLAELEARGFLKPSEMSELNRLRTALAENWPEVSAAVARAYLEQP